MYKHILLPTDGSELSKKAVKHGVALAKALKAKITAVTVSPPFRPFASESIVVEDTSELAAQYLAAVRKAAAAAGVVCDVMSIEADQPYQAIIAAAKKKRCDLIVMASHGRRGISAIVLGSETVKVLTHSTIPVLVCR
jgi:nucleotide-binding universal stress UspA family protein